jgi:hypothetical protein
MNDDPTLEDHQELSGELRSTLGYDGYQPKQDFFGNIVPSSSDAIDDLLNPAKIRDDPQWSQKFLSTAYQTALGNYKQETNPTPFFHFGNATDGSWLKNQPDAVQPNPFGASFDGREETTPAQKNWEGFHNELTQNREPLGNNSIFDLIGIASPEEPSGKPVMAPAVAPVDVYSNANANTLLGLSELGAQNAMAEQTKPEPAILQGIHEVSAEAMDVPPQLPGYGKWVELGSEAVGPERIITDPMEVPPGSFCIRGACGGGEGGGEPGGELPKINGRSPINSQYAGGSYPIEKLPPDLQAKYPNSVDFKRNGYANFTPYAKDSVQIDGLTGKRGPDEILANAKAGLNKTPEGFTWHHVEDGKTMELVPSDIHDAVRHTGGAAIIKGGN